MENTRIYAEISRGALRDNMRAAALLAGKPLCAVVKADAYGHGAEEVARLCEQEGLRYLAVATAEEALRLRKAGIRMPVLVLGFVSPGDAPELAHAGVAQTVFDVAQAKDLSAALPAGLRLTVHIKADTGMGRLGLRTAEEIGTVLALPGLNAEGLYTHFATADKPCDPFVARQLSRFQKLGEEISVKNAKFSILHCENSGAVLHYRGLPGDMARAGLVLYGYASGGEENLLRPAMRLVTTVAQVKRLETGDSVSYDRRFIADSPRDIAVLCCGYADGYHRILSGRADVLIRGRRAPLIGNICMDMMMADVSGIPLVQPGDKALLFGRGEDGEIPLTELAKQANTIPYELLCAVSARVPRVYVD